MKITVLYVGASLLSPLKKAEAEIARQYNIDFQVAAHNCGAAFAQEEWLAAKRDLEESAIIFIIHVTDDENARLIRSTLASIASSQLASHQGRQPTIVAFNCMPDLMRLTRLGKLDFNTLMKSRNAEDPGKEASGQNLVRKLGSWMSDTFKGRNSKATESANDNDESSSKEILHASSNDKPKRTNHGQYVKLINKLPQILKFIPSVGKVRDIKNYLYLFCYFLQPTPNNIRSMLLYAIKHYAGEWGSGGGGEEGSEGVGEFVAVEKLFKRIKVDAPETMPSVGIYHPDSAKLFETFEAYQKWYEAKRKKKLERHQTIGLLLMRPQIISDARHHYDALIRSIEDQGLSVIPAISTFMDNRDACRIFFIEPETPQQAEKEGKRLDEKAKGNNSANVIQK